MNYIYVFLVFTLDTLLFIVFGLNLSLSLFWSCFFLFISDPFQRLQFAALCVSGGRPWRAIQRQSCWRVECWRDPLCADVRTAAIRWRKYPCFACKNKAWTIRYAPVHPKNGTRSYHKTSCCRSSEENEDQWRSKTPLLWRNWCWLLLRNGSTSIFMFSLLSLLFLISPKKEQLSNWEECLSDCLYFCVLVSVYCT